MTGGWTVAPVTAYRGGVLRHLRPYAVLAGLFAVGYVTMVAVAAVWAPPGWVVALVGAGAQWTLLVAVEGRHLLSRRRGDVHRAPVHHLRVHRHPARRSA